MKKFDHNSSNVLEACGVTKEEVEQIIALLPNKIKTTSELVQLLCDADSDPAKILAIVSAYTDPRLVQKQVNVKALQPVIDELPEITAIYQLIHAFLIAPRDATLIAAMLLKYTPLLISAHNATQR